MTDRDGSSPDDEVRLRELAEFLRERRARLDPEQLGLPARRRRRTPGLRREDVAERAAVSIAWYASLEQGRPVNPSKAVVSSLADALCLSDLDRAYLFKLAGHPAPPITELAGLDARLLQALVDHIAAPAYCTDALTNVMAWNAAACEVFGDYGRWPPARRNLLVLLFEETGFAERLVDRDDYAERVVRTFRGRSNAHRNDPLAIELVDTLSRRSERFRSRGVHKLSRVPDPLDLQEHRISAPHALDDRQRPLHSLIHDRDPIEPADADTVSEPHGFACAW